MNGVEHNDKLNNQCVVFSQILKKNKCSDLFRNTIIDEEKGLRMFEAKTEKKFV